MKRKSTPKIKIVPLLISLILIVGIFVALKLVQRNQNIQNKATSRTCAVGNIGTYCTNSGGLTCQQYRLADCTILCNQKCKKTTCSPNTKKCVDYNHAVATCNSTGTQLTYTVCPKSTSCSNGFCVTSSNSCTSDARKCVDNNAYFCNSQGTWTKLICSSREVCTNGYCKTKVNTVCTPGTKKCSGTGINTCRDDGNGWNYSSCGSMICFNGACVSSRTSTPTPVTR